MSAAMAAAFYNNQSTVTINRSAILSNNDYWHQ
jgi:hypothetical protein